MRNVRRPLVGRIDNNVEKLLGTTASDWCDDPKLGEVKPFLKRDKTDAADATGNL